MSCLIGSRTRIVLTRSSRGGRDSFHSCGGTILTIPDCMPYESIFSICRAHRLALITSYLYNHGVEKRKRTNRLKSLN